MSAILKLRRLIKEEISKLHELDITDPQLQSEIEEYAELSDKIDKLMEQLKKMEVRYKELDVKFVDMLEQLERELGNSKETFIRAKNILITIKKRGGLRTSFKYKEAFDWLYARVNPQMKNLIDQTMEAHKTISQVKSSLAVQREQMVNENWLSQVYNKIKGWMMKLISKLQNTNETANASLDKLERMLKM